MVHLIDFIDVHYRLLENVVLDLDPSDTTGLRLGFPGEWSIDKSQVLCAARQLRAETVDL